MQIKGEPKLQTVLELSAVPGPRLCLHEDVLEYDPEEIKPCSDLGAQESLKGWCLLTNGRFCMPKVLGQSFALLHALVS